METHRKKAVRIFIVEDDKFFGQMIKKNLELLSKNEKFEDYVFRIYTYGTGEECLENLNLNPAFVILDHYLDSENKDAKTGLLILKDLKKRLPDTKVIVLSSQKEIVTSVEMMKSGAFEYIVKDNNFLMRLTSVFEDVITKHEKKGLFKLWEKATNNIHL